MTWEDRLRPAAYTSPNGTRVEFTYEDVIESFDKRTAAFEFPDADGTLIQDLGKSGRRYPFRVIFHGPDCDLEAAQFMDLLGEQGQGRLEHPIYGVVDVVPFGTIVRRDALKNAANQAIIDVSFWETIGVTYPTNQSDPASEVIQAIQDFNGAQAEEFEEEVGLDTVSEEATFKSIYETVLTVTDNTLKEIAAVNQAVEKQFNEIKASIDAGLDTLIDDPLTLAFQTVQLIQAPARALAAITDRLAAYKGLADLIFGRSSSVNTFSDFKALDLNASSYMTGSVLSVVNNQFETKPAALSAAEELLTQFEDLTNWRDENYELYNEIDTGASYQQLQEAVSIAAGFLVEISFSLKQERVIVLDRDRTIIDLVAELYGEIDEQLDFLIESNQLTGSEILELPAGKEIVYYV